MGGWWANPLQAYVYQGQGSSLRFTKLNQVPRSLEGFERQPWARPYWWWAAGHSLRRHLAPVSADLPADPDHLLNLHVPLPEAGLGVIVLVAGDGDVSASEQEIAHLNLMHFPASVSVPFNNWMNHSSAVSNHKDQFWFWKYPREIIPLLEGQRVLKTVLKDTIQTENKHPALITQPLRGFSVLDDGLEDEGGHRGVNDVSTDPSLGKED